MRSWETFAGQAPELAAAVRGRFEAHGLVLLATLRRDGSPRISPIEAFFGAGELWLGMMEPSRKATDLERDPRLALHSATTDKEVRAGDAKISGRAVEVTDAAGIGAFVAAVSDESGQPPPEPFRAFRVEVDEASTVRIGPGGDHLVIESWRVGEPTRRIERR